MLDMGFMPDIKRILALLPQARQNLLFSATYSDEIRQLADKLLKSPVYIDVARRNTPAELVGQVVHKVDRERKRELLSHLIRTQDWRQVLVFTRTKHGANRLAEQLGKDGVTAAAIHGNKSQGARTRALADFKAGNVRVLVATDIAARGLDIDQLPHVVNFELPNVAEDYVHRIGRTGRAGASGEAVSLVCVDELQLLSGIERLIKRDLPVIEVAGFSFDPSVRPEPIANGRQRQQGRNAQRQGGERRPARNEANGNVARAKSARRPEERSRPAGQGQQPRRAPRKDGVAASHAPATPQQAPRRREVPALFMARRGDVDGNR